MLKLCIGLGLILVVVVAFWRRGGTVSSEGVTDGASAAPAPVRHKIEQRGDLRQSQPNSSSVTIATEISTSAVLRNLAATVKSIQAETDVLQKESKLDSLASQIATTDLSAAVEFLNEHHSSELSRDLSMRLIRRWAGNDPRAAADWVSLSSNGSARQEAINGVATVWANQNLPDAVEWVRHLDQAEERQGGLMSVAYETARTEPIEAIRLAMALPANEAREDLIAHTVAQWATRFPEAAADWANQMPDGALRERLLADIATAWGDNNPVAAGTLAVNSLTPGRQRDDAVVGIVQRWVQTKPEEAAAWVSQFPDGTLRDTALEELVKLWADQNLEQAGNWLLGHALESSRDLAVRAYLSQITPLFPELAARWTANIDDEALRSREMETVGEAWMGSDAAAARAWIAQSPLTETAKGRLLALKPE